jgi:hypothetical protein
MKLKKKEFTNLRQGNMMVNEYLNSFIQLSRYATEDINTDERKQDMFLEELNDDIQFQLLNTDYIDFQHMVDKAIVIESKLKEMEKDGKRKMPFPEQPLEATLDLASVIPRSEIAGTKPPYMCPGCFTHTYSNNMINRFHVQ